MRLLLALALPITLLLAPPALAEDPPAAPQAVEPISIKGWDLMRYSEHLIQISFASIGQILDSQQQALASGDPTIVEDWLTQARAISDRAVAQLEATPAWKGDRSMVEENLASWAWARGLMDDEFPELFSLMYQEEVHNADLARVEEITRSIDAEAEAREAAAEALEEAFARRHGAVLVDSEEMQALESRGEGQASGFTHPGLVPQGSVLDPAVHASFAMRYHNMVLVRQVAMVNASNAFIEATNGPTEGLQPALDAALTEVRAQLKGARAMEDWGGDASLRDGLIQMGEQLEQALSGDFASYVTLVNQVRLKPKEVEALNAHARTGDQAVSAALSGFSATQTAFQERWGLLAFQEWATAPGGEAQGG